MGESGSGDRRVPDTDLGALPPELAKQSISSGMIILPFDAALQAIELLTKSGRRLENWEGWVRLREGSRAKSLAHPGSFALSPDAARAAEAAAASMRKAHQTWARSPEYPGAELYFGLTFGAK